MNWKYFYSSVKGTSHIASNTLKQDSCEICEFNNYLVSAVADGAGSAKHSDLSSKFICKLFVRKSKQWLISNKLENLTRAIISEWFIYFQKVINRAVLRKQYRLKVIKSNTDSVKLKNRYLIVEYNLKTPAKLINNWYKDKALSIYKKELDKCFQQFITYKVVKPNLKIRKLTKRWGSYNKNSNTITMNIETIKANKDCIDYVIYHELCHSMHFSHNKEFYNLLESKCKDWNQLKYKLETLIL